MGSVNDQFDHIVPLKHQKLPKSFICYTDSTKSETSVKKAFARDGSMHDNIGKCMNKCVEKQLKGKCKMHENRNDYFAMDDHQEDAESCGGRREDAKRNKPRTKRRAEEKLACKLTPVMSDIGDIGNMMEHRMFVSASIHQVDLGPSRLDQS